MNKHFEPIVLETYAELCVRWRMAHVENRVQAADFDAQLKALESVIQSFNLNIPGAGESSKPKEKEKENKVTARKDKPEAAARGGSVILEQ